MAQAFFTKQHTFFMCCKMKVARLDSKNYAKQTRWYRFNVHIHTIGWCLWNKLVNRREWREDDKIAMVVRHQFKLVTYSSLANYADHRLFTYVPLIHLDLEVSSMHNLSLRSAQTSYKGRRIDWTSQPLLPIISLVFFPIHVDNVSP